MMLIAVCSLKGSPGVTTFSVALAACRWPDGTRCVLLEADPAGGDLAVRFGLPVSPGLVSLAAAARNGSDSDLLWRHTQLLPGGLRLVVCPPGADQTRMALSALVEGESEALQQAAAAPDAVVVVDVGRVDPSSAALSLLRSADHLLLLNRSRADDLAHLAARLPTVETWSQRLGLLLVGAGYPAGEVRRELGVPVMATIPDDRRTAAALSGRPLSDPRSRRGLSRSALGWTAARVASAIRTSVRGERLQMADAESSAVQAPMAATDGVVG